MGLIIEKIKVKWNVNSRKHYEKLGYKWTQNLCIPSRYQKSETASARTQNSEHLLAAAGSFYPGSPCTRTSYRSYLRHIQDMSHR